MDVLNEPPGRLLNVRLGHPLDVIFGSSQYVRSRRSRDGQIGCLGDVLGTNICHLGRVKKVVYDLQ